MGACRIVYFGDIMGATGRRYLQAQLPSIKQHYQPDFIFANAENATNERINSFISAKNVEHGRKSK